jgi:hypothetical protein
MDWKPSPFQEPRNPKAMVVIKYRNGVVIGPIEAGSRRWAPWSWGETDWDIEFYSVAK